MRCFLLILPVMLAAGYSSAQASGDAMRMDEWVDEVASSLVRCQDKVISAPAANENSYISIRTTRVCAPGGFPPAHDEGIEARCLVRFTVRGDGVPVIESSACNMGLHGDFEEPEGAARKFDIARRVYEATSAKAAGGWRYQVSNELEADNLGTIQLPFEFVVKAEGPHTFDPVNPDAKDVGPDFDAHDLVGSPRPDADEDDAS